MTWEQLTRYALQLPEVTEDLWYRRPAFKVRGKGFASLKEEGVVAFVLESLGQQEFLLHERPDLYFITDHYRGQPWILARLKLLRVADAEARLEEAWREKAPKALRAE